MKHGTHELISVIQTTVAGTQVRQTIFDPLLIHFGASINRTRTELFYCNLSIWENIQAYYNNNVNAGGDA